jgi:hypothetical protein
MNTNIDQANRDNTTELCKISTGRYERIGTHLTKGVLKLLVLTRKNTNSTKPPQFLILKRPVSRWISSLYPTLQTNTYNFDDKGIKYKLKLNKTKAIITLR